MKKKTYRSKKRQPKIATEKQVHKAVCNYIRMVYPDAVFFSDMSGLKTSIGTATDMKALRSSSAIPDLFVASPQGNFKGLFVEIKACYDDVFRVDGSIRQTEHILKQAKMLDKLSHLGYEAVFGAGQSDCERIVDRYFK